MAHGKNKKTWKKGLKKKLVEPFARKDWYDIKAPSMFTVRAVGKTCVNKTQGLKLAEDGLRGRVVETNLGDLNRDETAFRKFRLIVEEIQGKNCLTNFHGMSINTDKIRSMVKKWQTLIEASVDARTTDGYTLRFFCIAFTSRRANQIKKTCYAQSAQVRAIRKKMLDIITKEVVSCDLKAVVSKLIPDSFARDIEKACQSTYPITDVHIRKVKVLKKPKFDMGKLLEMHGEQGSLMVTHVGETGENIHRPDNYEPPVQSNV